LNVGTLLNDKRRVNVLLSRAKHKLIFVGSASTLSTAKLNPPPPPPAAAVAAVAAAKVQSGGLSVLPASSSQPPAPSIAFELMRLLNQKKWVVQLPPRAHLEESGL
jgi:hypothetical protein